MSESVHAHQVMQAMLEDGRAFDQNSLKQFMQETFGEAAQYHNCKMQGMSAQQLIDFLEARGKFQHSDEGFNINQGKVCNHA